jgi:hypothetical protein
MKLPELPVLMVHSRAVAQQLERSAQPALRRVAERPVPVALRLVAQQPGLPARLALQLAEVQQPEGLVPRLVVASLGVEQ